jgi:hypothetical protein
MTDAIPVLSPDLHRAACAITGWNRERAPEVLDEGALTVSAP